MVKQSFSGCPLVSKLAAGRIIAIIAALLFLTGCEQKSIEERAAGADLILKNGVIYTQDDIHPQAQAFFNRGSIFTTSASDFPSFKAHILVGRQW